MFLLNTRERTVHLYWSDLRLSLNLCYRKMPVPAPDVARRGMSVRRYKYNLIGKVYLPYIYMSFESHA